MIDAERMLGSLVRNAMGGRKRSRGRRRGSSILGRGAKSGLALGALGVAFGVFEHLSKQQGAGGAAGAGAGSTTATGLPPVPQAPAGDVPLPPVPGAESASTAAGPLPPLPAAPAGDQAEALLLIRAMIAAANADHEVDDEESARILRSLDESGLGEEERGFLAAELESPVGMSELVAGATTPELASQVYLASLMAIEVDTRAEEKYLARLAERLGLDAARVAELEGLLVENVGE